METKKKLEELVGERGNLSRMEGSREGGKGGKATIR